MAYFTQIGNGLLNGVNFASNNIIVKVDEVGYICVGSYDDKKYDINSFNITINQIK